MPNKPKLSPDQLQALQMMSDGYSVPMISTRIGVGERTIHSRLRLAREKLGAYSTCQAVSLAILRNLIAGPLV